MDKGKGQSLTLGVTRSFWIRITTMAKFPKMSIECSWKNGEVVVLIVNV